MIERSQIEQRRSPAALRQFVVGLKEAVNADEPERHRGILKNGLYKQFLEELVPLSFFATWAFPETHEMLPVLGNQGYDAVVFSHTGEEVDRIEITTPHDGAAAATDARCVVNRGYGQVHVGSPGDDFEELFPHALAACRKKAQKDYGDCTLVVAIAPLPPFPSLEARYEQQIEALASEMARITFKAKRVFLVVLPDKVVAIHG